MKLSFFDIIKAKYLINENASKNWTFIMYVIGLCLIVIWNIQHYEEKIFKINKLTKQVKELRSEFVDTRSFMMKLKMESTITKKMESIGIYTSDEPPIKIKVLKQENEE